MATGKSGSFELSGTKGFGLKVAWSETYETATNTSVVSITSVQVKSTSNYLYRGEYWLKGTVKVNDTAVVTFDSTMGSHSANVTSLNSYATVSAKGSYPAAPWKSNAISHNSDGTKSVTIAVDVAGYTVSGDNGSGWKVTGSNNVELTSIPRASAIVAVADVTLGNACSVKWVPASASFRYKLKFSMGNWSYTTAAIHPNRTSDYTYTGYTIPLVAANQIPNNPSGTMTVTLYTYSDSAATTQAGSAVSETFTVTVPDNADTKPNATSMTLTPVSSLGDSFAALYIQGYSKVKVTSKEAGQLGATVVSKTITVEGRVYDGSSGYTSDYISGYGNIDVKLTLEDSRGFVNAKTVQIPVIAYSRPKVVAANDETKVICARCDANGNLTDQGTYLKIKARRSYSPCMSNGVQKNFCGLRYRYKRAEDSSYSSWVTLLSSTTLNTEEVNSSPLLNGSLSTSVSYMVEVDAVDSISNHTPMTFNIPTERVYLHKAGSIHGFAFGKYAELANTIDIAEDIAVRVRDSINGVYMATKPVSGTSTFDIQTKYSEFATTGGTGVERQSLFIFGVANGSIVYGVAVVSNTGVTTWQGTSGVTLSTKSGGILTVKLPQTAYDWFTIISSRKFSV